MVEQNDETRLATPSKSVPNDELIKLHCTPNSIVVDVDHDDKQIIVEVPATSIDTIDMVATSPHLSIPSSSFLIPPCDENSLSLSQSHGAEPEFIDLTELKCGNIDAATEKSPILNQTSDDVIDQSASKLNINDTPQKSYEIRLNDTMAIQLTPTMGNRSCLGTTAKRTSIGVIRLSGKTNDAPVNGNEMYEILLTEKVHILPTKTALSHSVDRIMNNFEETPVGKAYPLYVNNAVARKSTATGQQFPIAPSTILQRIRALQEYNRNRSMQRTAKAKAKPKIRTNGNEAVTLMKLLQSN